MFQCRLVCFPQRLELLVPEADKFTSCWLARHDVSHPLQSTIRIAARALFAQGDVEADLLQPFRQLDPCSLPHGESRHPVRLLSQTAY